MNIGRIKIFLSDRRTMFGLWILLGIISALTKLTRHNNFDIFRYVFYNTWNQTSLYAENTDGGYWDINHYGPFFSIIIAPFAVIPTWLGLILWNTCLAVFLYWATARLMSLKIESSTFQPYLNILIVYFCAHELLTALFMQQFNIAIAAIIMLSFYFVEKERDEYATFFIVVGTLVKLYGIVGLVFFFFSKHKVRYLISLIIWSVVLFCLPMLISSPEFQIQQYQEWFTNLMDKNAENILSGAQNISLMGMITKITYGISGGKIIHDASWIILPGMLLMAIGYFRICQWKSQLFRIQILAAVMMFVVLFSTGSESSGYITPFVGICIWYCCVPWQRTRWDIALMIFAFFVTSMSPSDIFPAYIRKEWIQPYALKALPITIIWLKLAYEIICKSYIVNPQSANDTAKL